MATMRCNVCGGQLEEGDAFCPNCGSPVVVTATTEEVPLSAPIQESEGVAPAAEEATPAAEEATPAAEGAEPAAEKAEPAAEAASPIVEETVQVAEEAAPVVEAVAPIIEEASPIVEEVAQETTVLKDNPYTSPSLDNNTYHPVQQDSYFDSQQTGYTDPQQDSTYYTQSTDTQPEGQPEKKESKTFGLIGMICGIVSILCCVAGPLFALPGVILSIVAMVKKEKKAFPIVGIITSVFGFIIGIIVLILLVYAAESM